MSPWWLLLGAVPAAAAYLAGDGAGARRALRTPGTLREAAARLLRRGTALGFPGDAGEPAARTAASELSRDIDNFRVWLDEQWRRSEEERRRLAAVLAGLTEGIILLDRYGRVLLTNEGARQLWPRLSPRLLGRHHLELFQDAACDRALSEALRSGCAQQAELSRPGPPARHFRMRALPLPGDPAPGMAAPGWPEAPDVAGALVVIEDVTRQKAIDQIRRDFVANVSHELQTPLTSVRGYAETLLGEEGLDADERRRFCAHILRESERMTALVRDLLALAQLEAPRWAEAEPVDLDALAGEVVAANRAMAEQRGLDLALEPAGGSGAYAAGRPDELRRAVDNLVRNALAYTPRGGSVRVRVGPRGAEMAVAVADTGIGIAPDALPRIFERFFRVDRGRSREAGATGLGLAIVKHTAEGHGGRVEVESTPGRGSTFTLLLPPAPAPASPDGGAG